MHILVITVDPYIGLTSDYAKCCLAVRYPSSIDCIALVIKTKSNLIAASKNARQIPVTSTNIARCNHLTLHLCGLRGTRLLNGEALYMYTDI